MRLADTLAEIAFTLAARRSAIGQEAVDEQLRRLVAGEYAKGALGAGEMAPEFELTEVASGARMQLADFLDHGPTVVAFVRGFWCPYCNATLRALAAERPALAAAGAQLVAITVEPLAHAATGVLNAPLGFPLLHDRDARVSALYGLAYPMVDRLARLYEAAGVALARVPDGGIMLPVPATYVVRQDGVVSHAFVDIDWTRRPEPAELTRAVANLKVGA